MIRFDGVERRLSLLIELRHPLLRCRNARLEFGLVDQASGVTVDEPIGAAPECCHLTIELYNLLRRRRAILYLADAALVFVRDPVRICQQGSHLVPHDLFELVAMH